MGIHEGKPLSENDQTVRVAAIRHRSIAYRADPARRQPQGEDALELALADCKPKERASLTAALERLREILVANGTPNGATTEDPKDQAAPAARRSASGRSVPT